MAILGCGNMGTAILDGILSALKQQPRRLLPGQVRPSRIIACVNRLESVARLEHRFRKYLYTNNISNDDTGPSPVCQFWQNNNAEAVELADVVLLACQPSQAAEILGDPSMRKHLSSKFLLSICVGMSAAQIHGLIYGDGGHHNSDTTAGGDERCYIVHAMPNMASTLGESATVLSATGTDNATSRPLPPDLGELADWIFSSIGTVTHVHPSLMNAASVAGASSLAFFATAMEGVVRGATDMGLSESDALHLAAQAMKGTAAMVLKGGEMESTTTPPTTPSKIRDEVMTPNGCTAHGMAVLHRARAENAFAEATRKAVERVFELGTESS